MLRTEGAVGQRSYGRGQGGWGLQVVWSRYIPERARALPHSALSEQCSGPDLPVRIYVWSVYVGALATSSAGASLND